jgi:hypothetical protein
MSLSQQHWGATEGDDQAGLSIFEYAGEVSEGAAPVCRLFIFCDIPIPLRGLT